MKQTIKAALNWLTTHGYSSTSIKVATLETIVRRNLQYSRDGKRLPVFTVTSKIASQLLPTLKQLGVSVVNDRVIIPTEVNCNTTIYMSQALIQRVEEDVMELEFHEYKLEEIKRLFVNTLKDLLQLKPNKSKATPKTTILLKAVKNKSMCEIFSTHQLIFDTHKQLFSELVEDGSLMLKNSKYCIKG